MRQNTLLVIALFLAVTVGRAQTVTVGGIDYQLDGTTGTAVITTALESISGDLVLDEISYNGRTYRITAIADMAFQGEYPNLTSLSMPNVKTMGEACFGGSITGIAYPSLTTLDMPNLETMGAYCFTNGFLCNLFPELTVLNLSNLKTMGNSCFYNANSRSILFPKVTSISLPNIETMGDDCFHSNVQSASYYMSLTRVDLPISVQMGKENFYGISGRVTYYIADAEVVYENNSGATSASGIYGSFYYHGGIRPTRIIVPVGKAAMLVKKWNIQSSGQSFELYTPIHIRKTNDGYNTLAIPREDPCASFTYEGETFDNYYDFNKALSEAEALRTIDYNTAFGGSNYQYKWFVATGYTKNGEKEGTLTITSPDGGKGVGPGRGFMLKGPATNLIYAPVRYDTNGLIIYDETWEENFFKAGTGAAVPSESDGCRNFYYTDPTGFWECQPTTIPADRAYLALPTELMNDAKQFRFVFDDGESQVTGIIDASVNERGKKDDWYTLDGRRLQDKPAGKGIYIRNGRKEVVK